MNAPANIRTINDAERTPEPAMQVFKPSRMNRATMWVVGGRIAPHYTAADVHAITSVTPSMVGLSVSMATIGAASYLSHAVSGITIIPAVAGAGVGYFLVDRMMVSVEPKIKARRIVRQQLASIGLMRPPSILSKVIDSIPLAVRFAMAGAAAFITSDAIMIKIAQNEVTDQIAKEYQRDNQNLFAQLDARQKAYDQQIIDLSAHAEADRAAIEQQKTATLNMATANPSSAQATVDQRMTVLESQIAQQQTVVAKDQARLDAEENGGQFAGATGKPGKGTQYATDKAQLAFDQQQLATLIAQRAILQTQMIAAAKRDQAAVAAQGSQQATLAQTGGELQQDLASTDAKVAQLQTNRSAKFQELQDAAEHDPTYKPKRSGFFAESAALLEYTDDPDVGWVAKGQTRALAMVLFFAELSAAFYAASRKPTPAEIQDAQIEYDREEENENAMLERAATRAGKRAGLRKYVGSLTDPASVQSFQPDSQRPKGIQSRPIAGFDPTPAGAG